MKLARLVWLRYLAEGKDSKTIPTLEKLDALAIPASPIMIAATADIKVLFERAISSLAVQDDEEDWKMVNLVEVDTEERVEVKRRHRDIQE